MKPFTFLILLTLVGALHAQCENLHPTCLNLQLQCKDLLPTCKDCQPKCEDLQPICQDLHPHCNNLYTNGKNPYPFLESLMEHGKDLQPSPEDLLAHCKKLHPKCFAAHSYKACAQPAEVSVQPAKVSVGASVIPSIKRMPLSTAHLFARQKGNAAARVSSTSKKGISVSSIQGMLANSGKLKGATDSEYVYEGMSGSAYAGDMQGNGALLSKSRSQAGPIGRFALAALKGFLNGRGSTSGNIGAGTCCGN